MVCTVCLRDSSLRPICATASKIVGSELSGGPFGRTHLGSHGAAPRAKRELKIVCACEFGLVQHRPIDARAPHSRQLAHKLRDAHVVARAVPPTVLRNSLFCLVPLASSRVLYPGG
jgi:hypothetical protein